MEILCSITFFKVAIVSIIIFILLDLTWLSLIARKIYFNQLGYLAEIKNNRVTFNMPVGLLIQAIIALGLAVLITVSLQVNSSLSSSIIFGGFCGFLLYATYDLTNLSFIKNWPVPITLIDMAWGTAQGIFAGFYVYYLFRVF